MLRKVFSLNNPLPILDILQDKSLFILPKEFPSLHIIFDMLFLDHENIFLLLLRQDNSPIICVVIDLIAIVQLLVPTCARPSILLGEVALALPLSQHFLFVAQDFACFVHKFAGDIRLVNRVLNVVQQLVV